MLAWIKRKKVDGFCDDLARWVADLGGLRFVIDEWPTGPVLLIQYKIKTVWRTKKHVTCKNVKDAKEKAEFVFDDIMTIYKEGIK